MLIDYFLANSDKFIAIFALITTSIITRYTVSINYQTWVKTFSGTMTLLLLPIITYSITSVISGNIALSLGMVGALSIVRFRNPVKSPFELVMFFGLLTLGITCSVSLNLAFLLFALIIVVIFGIRIVNNMVKKIGLNLFEHSFGDGNLNFSIEVNTSERIKEFENYKSLIYFYHDNKNKEHHYRLVFSGRDELKLKLKKKLMS